MLGGVAAWLGFTLPSAALLIGLGLYANSADLSSAGWVHGLKLAAVAVVALAVLTMASNLLTDWPRRVIALAALAVALLVALPLTQVALIICGGVLGYLVLGPVEAAPATSEPSPLSRRAGALLIGAFFVLLLAAPIAARVTGSPTVGLLSGVFDSGALVFGGGHVVLPLLHATTVDPGWVGESQFLAGYGATQAVPGPLFTFSAFLGTVANVPPGGAAMGIACLIAIFAPSFLLVWGTLPFWNQLRQSSSFRRALGGTNAAVVGVLAAALYNPVWTSSVTDWRDVAVAALAFGALATRRVPPILVVGACALIAQLLM